jgi:hypothetical protein
MYPLIKVRGWQVQGWAGASRGRFLVTFEVVPDPSVAAPSSTHVPAGVQKTGESEFLLWEEVQSDPMLLARIKMPRVCRAHFSLKVLSEACSPFPFIFDPFSACIF